jgi:hypothetical protein
MNDRCPKKKTLLLAWHAATKSYSEAASEFARNAGQVTSDDHERFKRETERTRTEVPTHEMLLNFTLKSTAADLRLNT